MATVFHPTGHLAHLRITDRETINDARFGMDAVQRAEIQKCWELVHAGQASGGKHIRKQIDRWPNNPIFLNYLGSWHGVRGEREQAMALVEQTYERFPDYLFAGTNMANTLLAKERPDEALPYLGPDLRIEQRWPGREEFHIREVEAYEQACIKYLIAKEELLKAQERLKVLRSVSDDTEWIDKLDEYVLMGLVVKRHAEEEAELARMPQMEFAMQPVSPDAERELVLQNAQLRVLFERSMDLSPEELREILTLPRESLVQDLRAIVQHSIDRFHHNKENKEELRYEQLSFVNQAIMLLGELRGADSLEAVLLALSQSREYLDLYLGDSLTEEVWEPIAKLAEGQFHLLDAFMRKPRLHSFSKVVVSEGVGQLGQHRPDLLPQVEQWYAGLLAFYNAASPQDEVMDATQLALMVGDILDLGLTSLLPAVEALYARDIVPSGVVCNIDQVRETFNEGETGIFKREMLPFEERYAEQAAMEARAAEEYDSELDNESLWNSPLAQLPITRAMPKVGRNDPCPCGSGKKYKKCCAGKAEVLPAGLRGWG